MPADEGCEPPLDPPPLPHRDAPARARGVPVRAQDVREIGRHRRPDEGGMKARRSPQVLFEAWRGRYSDSPRAISEALSEICADFRPTWVLNDATAPPPGVRRVARYRARHLAALLPSDYLIKTDIVPT